MSEGRHRTRRRMGPLLLSDPMAETFRKALSVKGEEGMTQEWVQSYTEGPKPCLPERRCSGSYSKGCQR